MIDLLIMQKNIYTNKRIHIKKIIFFICILYEINGKKYNSILILYKWLTIAIYKALVINEYIKTKRYTK